MKLFEIITLFPQAFPGTLDFSIFKKSRGKCWNLRVHDMREFGIGRHKQVDDEVFGGSAGMLIRPDVIDCAMQHIINRRAKNNINKITESNINSPTERQFTRKLRKVFLSPRGRLMDQSLVETWANEESDMLLLCGRYEGVDARAIEHFEFEEISIGNYILAGAEVAAMVMMESIVRKIPGVIGNAESFAKETFVDNEVSEPRYTRPAVWETHDGNSISVPQIIVSGDHKKIAEFQKSGRKKVEL